MKNLFSFLLIIFLTSFQLLSQSWQSVANGTNNSSHGLLTWDGKLIDIGSFNNPCNRVAAWNGATWECLGGGVGIVARAGTVWNGNLVVVGDFWNVQQPCTNCNGVAMWDGTQWTNIGAGFNNDVLCVTVWNGDLVVAGDFTMSNGLPCSRIAKWTGTAWEQIGPSNAFNNDIRTITEFEGELWIGGDFTNVGGCAPCDRLVKWSGTAWVGGDAGVDVQGGVDGTVRVLYVNPYDGKLYMGGHFVDLNIDGILNTDCKGVAVYDGSTWEPLGTGVNDYVRAIHEYNGNIVIGGYFTTAGSISANRIAKWDPVAQTWSAMGLGFNGVGIDEYVKSATVWNGIFFAGGAYTVAESGPMNYISQWYETPVSSPIATINAEQTSLCTGGCFSFTDESTYGPTSWNWTFPGGSITSSTMQDPPPICYNTPGTYTVSLQACNSIGCNTTSSNITVLASTTVTVNNPTICAGASAVLTANPSTSGGSFLWSPGGQTTASITVSPTVNTTYNVTYTSSGCGSIMASSNVTVISTAPTVSVNNPTICEGSSTVLTANPSTGGGTYLWYPGNATTQSITVNPTSSQIYTVTYTLSGCSSNPTNATVTVNPTPTITVNNSTVCSGTSANLTAVPSTLGGSYLWSPGGQTTSTIDVSPSNTTTYSVIYTLNSCSSIAATGIVTVNQTPTLSVNSPSICEGSSTTLTANPSIGGGSYLWSPNSQTSSSITVNPSSTQLYAVVYTLNGCSSSPANATVTVNPVPTVTFSNQTICAGSNVTLSAIPSAAGGSYSWSPGGQTNQSITVSPITTTTYSVSYILNGCTSNAATGIVTVNPIPSVTVNDINICSGSSATLVATPSLPNGNYYWSPNGETTSSINVSPTTTESYSVVYTLDNCSSPAATATVTIISNPTIVLNNETICVGNTATLIATPSVLGGIYNWSPGGETSQSITVNPINTSVYTVEYTISGCPLSTETATVTVNPIPELTVNSESICNGNSAILTANPTILGGTYLWSPDGQTTQTISVNPSVTQSYSVIYTLNGCESIAQNSTVTVNENPTNGVIVTQNVLSSDQAGAAYQWVNCLTGNTAISGETNQTYTALIDGEFAVIVSLNGCESTSDCIVINTNSLIDLDESGIEIFPNPAENEINMLLNSSLIGAKLIITDAQGKELQYLFALTDTLKIDISNLTPGIYFICVPEKSSIRARFLKL